MLVSPLNAGADPAGVTFTDVTAAAGIDHVQHSFTGTPSEEDAPLFELRFMSGAAAVADVDNDGWSDLFVTRLDAPDILYRNLRDGTFEDISADAGFTETLSTNGAVFADVDNDGDRDLYLASLLENRCYLYINDGNGVFTEEALDRGAAIDTGLAHIQYSASAGDYDNDGWVDLHTNEWATISSPSHSRLLRNTGGTFEDETIAALVDITEVRAFASRFVDFDDDGWADLAVAGDFDTSRLFWNNTDGTFADGTTEAGVATDENGMGSAVGDYDNDGDLDWFVTSIFDVDETCEVENCMWGYTGNRLYENEGGRAFTDATDEKGVRDGGWGWGAAFWDYDNDGDLDLVMTNGQEFLGATVDDGFNHDALRLWRNEGPGTMTEVAASVGLTDARPGKGLLTFDYDNDGDLDLFVVNNGDSPVLYRNDGGNDRNFLRVRLVGTESAEDAFGARVYVTAIAGGTTQMREISGGSHYLGQSESIAHFGLGDHDGVLDTVRVVWPASGIEQELHDVTANQVLNITESRADPAPDLDGGADSDAGPDSDSDADTESVSVAAGSGCSVSPTLCSPSWLAVAAFAFFACLVRARRFSRQ